MTIETKYNIGDKVWFMYDNSVRSATVIKIDVLIEKNKNRTSIHKTISYGLFDYFKYPEDKLFPTKKELLKSL